MISSNIKNLYHPEFYHGNGIKRNFFEGWYFKTETKSNETLTVIVGIYRAPENLNEHESHAFVMVLLSEFDCLYYRYEADDFKASSSADEEGFYVMIGDNKFQTSGVTLNLSSSRLIRPTDREYEEYSDLLMEDWIGIINSKHSQDIDINAIIESQPTVSSPKKQDLLKNIIRLPFVPYSIRGNISFDNMVPLPTSRISPSVMGPFAYIPFLECNHGVLSISHRSHGNLKFIDTENNVKDLVFEDGYGYMEKDWGTSFPQSYIWTQANNFESEDGSSILFSVADVPFMSSDNPLSKISFLKKSLRYPGRLIIFYHGRTNVTYNFSTYKLSLVREFNVEMDDSATQHINVHVSNLRGFHLKIDIKRKAGRGIPLRAPIKQLGKMSLRVEESLDAEISVKLWRNSDESNNIIFHSKSTRAGLEVVGDVMWIARTQKKIPF